MGLHLQLFGAPCVLRDGGPVRFDTRKATALLAYLAVTGMAHRREALAGLLWPQADASRARAALRRTLSVASAAGPALRLAGPQVWLDGATCDVVAFEAALGSGDLAGAVDLARGPFLEGFALRDSPAFDDWQALTADRLRDALAQGRGQLAATCAAGGDAAGALVHARARLALDPFAEPAHRDLMRALALAGDRPGALRQYRALIRLLDRELDVPPLPQTAELAAAIRRGDPLEWPGAGASAPARSRAPGAVPTAAGRPAPALVERADLLEDLLARCRASAERPAIVGITGEAGIGRSAVLAALAARAGALGARVLSVRGRDSERHLGLAALAELLAPVIAEMHGSPLVEPLVGLAHEALPAADQGPGVQGRRLAGVIALLEASAGRAPTLLLVDDAHLVDASSGEELGYLLRRLPMGVCAVLAWPSDRAGLALPRAVAELDAASVLRLPGLSAAGVTELAGVGQGATLWERTRGVPRLVVECLASEDPEAADDLRALVGTRIDRLSPEALQVLTAASVLGTPAEPELLREVSGRDARGTVEAIEEALGLGLLLEVGPGYDLPHATVRSLVEERTSRARTALLHRRAADHLAAHVPARGTHPGVVARHYSRAGSPELAAPWHLRAARRALAERAHEEALEHLGQAGTGPAVAVLRGEVLVRLGRYDEALAALEGALAEGALVDAGPAGDAVGPEGPAATLLRLADVHDRLGEWAQARERLRAAEALLPAGPGILRARVGTDLALAAYRLGEFPEARALAEEVASGPADAAARARAWNVLGMVALAQGSADEGLAAFERSVAVATAVGAGEVAVAAVHNQSRALLLLGQLEAAHEMAQRALAGAEREADVHRIAAVASHVADVLHAMGRTQEAQEVQTRSARSLARVALPAVHPEVWLVADW
ncbi:MAG: tetratricopeptide repeat protein [Candidatus Nanopelagicales bacterium]|jgi:DNA-binding SARP family transcriptional activator|nr:tetratricopeptide repeat protein [Candidatus Nanopelagicales bacterium]